MAKLLNSEITKPISVTLDKAINSCVSSGVMKFGENNDYPQVIEKLVYQSQTAKACSKIFAKFIGGDGFVNESIGYVVVGKDNKGKPITLDRIRREIAQSLAFNYGVYIHVNMNLLGETGDTSIIPFKFCRFSTLDDNGNCAKVAVHKNWTKEKDGKKFDKKDINWFNIYNTNQEVIKSQVKTAGGIGKFKGQMYFCFLDNTYLYPLSPFDSVFLDMDTEYHMQLFKNREARNGFSDKIIMNVAMSDSEDEAQKTVAKTRNWIGADGEKLLLFESEFDDKGNLIKDGSFSVQEIKSNIDFEKYSNLEKSLANNIRKSIDALPAILIDYEQGTLSAVSGEAIKIASDYYNSLTLQYRVVVSEIIKEIYSKHSNELLKNNTDWSLKPVVIIQKEGIDIANETKLQAQATLKGSVGGVQALLQLQQSVAQGLTPVENVISIVSEIYGISGDLAKQMLIKPTQDGTSNV